MKKIYIVDDQKDITDLLVLYLRKEGYSADGYYDGITLLSAIGESSPDLVILDLYMPKFDGIQTMKNIKDNFPDVKILIITAYPENEKTELLVRSGAADIIAKPFKLSDIHMTIKRIFSNEVNNEQRDNCIKRRLIAESPKFLDCVDKALKVSNTDSPILLLGESGTGKEMLVDYIHCAGMRKHGKLVKINCASIPKELIESELFGYEKGSFTGAINSKVGKIEEANNGILFLDEISELDKTLQSKLLRVLEYKRFERLGSNNSIFSDFRLVCATNENIMKSVSDGNFREDLYYRISGFVIKIPVLCDRQEDIEPLIKYFIQSFREQYVTPVNEISKEALDVLKKYSWPGNVRELKNVIEMILAMAQTEIIRLIDLPPNILENHQGFTLCSEDDDLRDLEAIEKEYILKVLKKVNYSKKKAAAILGISERTLYNKVEKYNLS